MHEFNIFFDDPMWTKKANALRKAVGEPVAPPTPDTFGFLEPMLVEGEARPLQQPGWVRFVCRNRDVFLDSVFRLHTPQGPWTLKFCYAKQRPQRVCCAHVVDVDYTPSLVGESVGDVAYGSTWAETFQTQLLEFVFADDGTVDEAWEVDILFDAAFRKDGVLVSDSSWHTTESARDLPFGGMEEGEPALRLARPPKQPRRSTIRSARGFGAP
jgi:hypothetical protein